MIKTRYNSKALKRLVCAVIVLHGMGSTAQADLILADGARMHVAAGGIITTNQVVVGSGAQTSLAEETTISARRVHIEPNGIIEGCGILNADLLNEGSLIANCGIDTYFAITGITTNEGLVRVERQTALIHSNAFVNASDALLDMIFTPSALPPSLTGTGDAITATNLPAIVDMNLTGTYPEITIDALPGHRYQLERSTNLMDTNSWTAYEITFTVNARTDHAINDMMVNLGSARRVNYRYRIFDE
jgi:hypothetical protein